jgi:type III secretory pathway component EscU
MFLIALLCFAVTFYLLLMGFYQLFAHIIAALYASDEQKVQPFSFTVSSILILGPPLFALAGAILVYVSV